MPKEYAEFTERLQVRVSPSLAKRIDEMALKFNPIVSPDGKKKRGNVSSFIREAVREYMVRHAGDPAIVNLKPQKDRKE